MWKVCAKDLKLLSARDVYFLPQHSERCQTREWQSETPFNVEISINFCNLIHLYLYNHLALTLFFSLAYSLLLDYKHRLKGRTQFPTHFLSLYLYFISIRNNHFILLLINQSNYHN